MPAQSQHGTPAASHLPTPRSEPTPRDLILTAKEANVWFLKSLLQSAYDYLGKPIQGAVITVPSTFTPAQKDELREALEEASRKLFANSTDFKVYQLLEEAAATAVVTTSESWTNGTTLHPDRTQLVVDVGSSSLSLHLLAIRDGLFHVLGSSNTPGIGGDKIDEELIKFFAKEFTKKTKIVLDLNGKGKEDARALAKLRLALPHTKRTLSASPGAATCSVESLKDGMDFTSSINRMRFDLLVRPIYTSISSAVSSLLADLNIDAVQVDEIVYLGGTASLPGLDEHLTLSFASNVITPFSSGTVTGGGVGDPSTVLARGCAVQGALIHSLLTSGDESDKQLFDALNGVSHTGKVTSRTISLWFPGGSEEGTYIVLLPQNTPLPARRTVQFDVSLSSSDDTCFSAELVEVEEKVNVTLSTPEKVPSSDDEDEDEEEEPEEIKTKVLSKQTLLAVIQGRAKLGIKSRSATELITSVEAIIIASADLSCEVVLKEAGLGQGETVTVKLAAP